MPDCNLRNFTFIEFEIYKMKNLNISARINMPNLLLIAGNGRNVGKTFLACKIIEHLSQSTSVIGVKISPHFHQYHKDNVLINKGNFIILNETQNNTKDSSLMLQAGAKKVFFVMVKQAHLQNAFDYLKNEISNDIVICESGGLIEMIKPQLFLFVKRQKEPIVKKHLIQYSPILINNDGRTYDFDIRKISINNKTLTIRK